MFCFLANRTVFGTVGEENVQEDSSQPEGTGKGMQEKAVVLEITQVWTAA